MPTIITRGAASARGFGYGYKSSGVAPGSQSYTTAGTYTWVAPAGVTSVSIVAIGGAGKQTNGGGLGWKNNYTVTPGTSYAVIVGAGGTGNTTGCCSYAFGLCVVRGKGGHFPLCGGYVGDGGGNGGYAAGGGGGAGGYTGTGGQGASFSCVPSNGSSGSGGGGGGGAWFGICCCGATGWGAGGGGTGLFGQGSSGSGGTYSGSRLSGIANGGGGGSGGSSGSNATESNSQNGSGGLYGGAAGLNAYRGSSSSGGNGAVRIVWPGNTRLFPSTCVGSP